MARTSTFVSCFVFLLLVCDTATTASAQHPDTANPGANRLALLVGVDNYQYPSVRDLEGAVNDVTIMKALLMEQFGFAESSVMTLTNGQATRTAILDAIDNHLIAKAKAMKDPIVVFHYSGHGSQVKDLNGDEIDGRDETLVPYDSGRNEDPNNDITDDEINARLAQLTDITPYVTFIFDSCHSGSATRGAGSARTVAPDLRDLAPRPGAAVRAVAAAEGTSDLLGENDGYVLISGARADELSREYSDKGEVYGALTWHLAQQIRNSGADATYTDVMDLVRRQVSSLYPSQHPQLEGPGRERSVFGTKGFPADPHIMVSRTFGEGLFLEAGQAHGVTVDSVYDVFAPGTEKFEEASPIAQVKVSRVDVVKSAVDVISGGEVPDGARAVVREHAYPDAVLQVYIAPEDAAGSKGLRALIQELKNRAQVELQSEEVGYDLRIMEVADASGAKFFATEGGDPKEISPRVPLADDDAVERVVQQVLHWAKWFNTQRIKNETSGLSIAFEITADNGSGSTPVGEGSLAFWAGDRVKLTVRNDSDQSVYIAVLYLSSDGSMDVVYPRRGQQEFISPKRQWSQAFKVFVPEGEDSIRDIVKVIGTTSYADFHFLGQDAVPRGTALATTRGHSRSGLEQLLGQGVLGTSRGFKSIDTDQWVTAEKVVEISSRP